MFSFPLNMKQIKRVAGLLTCFLLRASFPSLVWGTVDKVCPGSIVKLTAGDLFRIYT